MLYRLPEGLRTYLLKRQAQNYPWELRNVPFNPVTDLWLELPAADGHRTGLIFTSDLTWSLHSPEGPEAALYSVQTAGRGVNKRLVVKSKIPKINLRIELDVLRNLGEF